MAERFVIDLEMNAGGIATGTKRASGEIRGVGAAAAGAATNVGLLRGALNALKANVIIAGVAALAGAVRLLGQGMRDAGINRLLDARLSQALRNLGGDAEAGAAGIRTMADEIERATGIEAEQVKTAAQMLATFKSVGSAEGIGVLLPRLADMAAGTADAEGNMRDLGSVAMQVGKALSGPASGLRRYGIELSDAQAAQLEAAEGMDRVNMLAGILDANFKGLAESAADPMVRLQNATGHLAEELGGKARDELAVLASRLTEIAQSEDAGRVMRWIGEQIAAVFRGIGVAMDVPRRVANFFRIELRETAAAVQGFIGETAQKLARFVSGAGDVLGRLPIVGDGIAERYERAAGVLDRFANAAGTVADRNREAAGEARKVRAEEDAARVVREEGAVAASRLARAVEEETDATTKATAAAKEYVGVLARTGQRIEELTRKKGDLLGASYAELVALGREAAALERQIALRERLVRIAVSGPGAVEGRLGSTGETSAADARGAFRGRDFGVELGPVRDEVSATEETFYRLHNAVEGLGPAFDHLSAGMASAFGRDAAAFKAVSLAVATISAYTAAAKMLSAGSPLTGVPRAIALLGIGLGYVGTIASIAIPGGGGGGSVPGRSPLTAGIGSHGYPQPGGPPVHVHNENRVIVENRVEPHDMFRLNTAIRQQDRLERAAFGEVSGADYMTGERRR